MKLFLRDKVPSNYNRATWLDIVSQVERQVNDLSEGRVSAYHGKATAAPTIGEWVRGDWVKNSLPSSSGLFGWICTESGSPGTWLGFGLIEPFSGGGISLPIGAQNITFSQSGIGATPRTLASHLQDTTSLKDFGTTATNINEWLTYVASVGGTHFWPFGSYSTSTQLVLNAGSKTLEIFCAGAVITTTGGISGFKVSGKSDPHSITIHDLIVDHRGNTDAIAGFEQVNTSYVRWPGCKVLASSSVPASYAAWYLHQSNVNDANTGCFWNDFAGAQVYSSSGRIPIGVLLEGACNATNFHGMTIANCTDCIKIISNSGGGVYYLSNGVMVVGARCEGFTNAVHVVGSSGQQTAEGLVIANSRFEDAGSDSYVLYLEGATVSAYRSPFLGANEVVAETGTSNVIVNNPQSLRVNKLELRETAVAMDTIYCGMGLKVQGISASDDAFVVEASNTGSGQMWRNAGSNVASARYAASGIFEIRGSSADGVKLALSNVHGISGASGRANNLRSQVTVSNTDTTATWTFATAESDTSYFILATPSTISGAAAAGASRVRSVAKNTGSAVLTLEAAPGAGTSVTFDVLLVR